MGRVGQTHLVTQFLEGISSKALEHYSQILKGLAGRRHGIYALYKRDKLYYVGLANRLQGRLNQHLRDRHAGKWDKFSVYLTLDNRFMRELETLVLHIVSPKGNSQRGKFRRAENLKARFKRELMAHVKSHVDVMMGGKTTKRRVGNQKDSDSGPILARYGVKSLRLIGKYKGKTYKALVLKDGSIRYGGKRYNSPSVAGIAARGRNTNGWTFWRFERAPGDWVTIDNLRQ